MFVLPIYAAGEDPIPNVTSDALVTSIVKHGNKEVQTVDDREQATEALSKIVKPGDLVLTLGAGDVWKVARDLAKRLSDGAIRVGPDSTESPAKASVKSV